MHKINLVEARSSGGFELARDRGHARAIEEPHVSFQTGFLLMPAVAKENVTVLLSGIGADQLFLGPRYERDLELWPWCRRLAPFLRVLPGWGQSLAKAKKWARLRTAAHIWALRHGSATFTPQRRTEMLDPAFLARVQQPETAQVLIDQYDFVPGRFEDTYQALCYLDVFAFACNRLISSLEQETMHFSLEGRAVFFDHDLVEFMGRLPSEHKARQSVRKYLLRRVAKKYIHPDCLAQKKHGFSLPMQQWVLGPLREFADAKISRLADSGVFRRDAVDWARKRLHDGPDSDGQFPTFGTWFLVSTQLWLEAYSLNTF
jgi:asparagine synthase (glutamine-hydrolysing)